MRGRAPPPIPQLRVILKCREGAARPWEAWSWLGFQRLCGPYRLHGHTLLGCRTYSHHSEHCLAHYYGHSAEHVAQYQAHGLHGPGARFRALQVPSIIRGAFHVAHICCVVSSPYCSTSRARNSVLFLALISMFTSISRLSRNRSNSSPANAFWAVIDAAQ